MHADTVLLDADRQPKFALRGPVEARPGWRGEALLSAALGLALMLPVLIATRRQLSIHHLSVQQLGGRLAISVDLEVEGTMPLGEAHDVATALEEEIRAELGSDVEVESHIEPHPERMLKGQDAPSGLTAEISAALRELAAAHALVLPSFAEGLPMVVMEAMAAARPVLATAIAGVPELVVPGETGWLVPAGDAAALTDALTGILQYPEPALACAERARSLVREQFTIEHSAAALETAWDSCIHGN